MSNKKQTAVEWLIDEMQKTYVFNQDDFNMFNQAKELEKQQIIDANLEGKYNPNKPSEQYYKETYGE